MAQRHCAEHWHSAVRYLVKNAPSSRREPSRLPESVRCARRRRRRRPSRIPLRHPRSANASEIIAPTFEISMMGTSLHLNLRIVRLGCLFSKKESADDHHVERCSPVDVNGWRKAEMSQNDQPIAERDED